jgi:hypothetical protein
MKIKYTLFILVIILLSSCRNENISYKVENLIDTPVIDGILDKCWMNIKKEPVNGKILKASYWKGEQDLSAFFRCAKDHDNLFFYIDVIDDLCRSYHDTILSEVWNNDGVGLYFINSDKKVNIDQMSDKDSIISFGFYYNFKNVFQTNAGSIHVEFCQKTNENGYSFEIKIPMTGGLKKRNKYSFNIMINDNDTPNLDSGYVKGVETVIGWSPNMPKYHWLGTYYYGDLLLGE